MRVPAAANTPPYSPATSADNLWPPAKDLPRLKRYDRGYRLYKGWHKDLYEPTRDELKHGPYVVCNVCRAVSRVIADRMALETPRALVGDETQINDTLAGILQGSDWGRLVLRSLRGWSYRGDLVYKALVRPKAERPRSILRRALNRLTGAAGQSEVLIREVLPDRFFPEWDPEDNERLQSAVLAWMIPAKRDEAGKITEWWQREERHTPGLIENRLFFLRRNEGVIGERYQRNEVVLKDNEQFQMIPEKVDTGIDEIPLVHIPNNEVGEDWPWGASDFADDVGFETNQRTLNERATDHRHMLRKWADPMVAADPSFFTGTDPKSFNVYEHKGLPMEQGERPPQYVAVPLENYPHSDAEADKALARCLWTVGISPESLGIYQGGSYPESGAAIRLRQSDTLNTVARRWVSYQPALQRILCIALQLAKAHAGGPEPVPPEQITIEHGDGLLQMEKERLEELAMKAQLGFSDEHIIREAYPDWDDEAVDAELQRRKDEKPAPFFGRSAASTRNAPAAVEQRAEELGQAEEEAL